MKHLESYESVLEYLAASGATKRVNRPRPALAFVASVPGIANLYHSLSAVAPAVPGTAAEEWNPLSQRPHAPLPPPVADELGAEITALTEAIDAVTTLCHEMMHVALWEPFFVGRWRPRRREDFLAFSLQAEGFCFFFSDIVVSGAVRERLPDGEFALERRTPNNARFHPVRAFQAVGLEAPERILDVYLDGFSGKPTRLWQRRGADAFAASLAAQTYDFYAGSVPYLAELHGALSAFGALTEFYRRFCNHPGLPSLLGAAPIPDAQDYKDYFAAFFTAGLGQIAGLAEAEVARVRWRRTLQTRAYYALQARWLVSEQLVVARAWSTSVRRRLVAGIEAYLDGLSGLLQALARQPEAPGPAALAALDRAYEDEVRTVFLGRDAWAGQRWLIAPRRAGGRISVRAAPRATTRQLQVEVLQIVAYLVGELTRRVHASKTVAERAAALAQIQRLCAIGAAAGRGQEAAARVASRRLRRELVRPHLRELWSAPLARFHPSANAFGELVFAYQ